MSANDYPCNRYSCVENVGGQCFGGGCRLNPKRRENDEDEINSEWFGEDENR